MSSRPAPSTNTCPPAANVSTRHLVRSSCSSVLAVILMNCDIWRSEGLVIVPTQITYPIMELILPNVDSKPMPNRFYTDAKPTTSDTKQFKIPDIFNQNT